MTDRDWMRLIDKRAAVKEQFPPLRSVMNERPGCQVDRDRQEFYRAENEARSIRGVLPGDVAALQDADADRFIARMARRERERFLARLNERRAG